MGRRAVGRAGEKPGVLFQTVGLSLKRGMLLRVAQRALHALTSRSRERDGDGVRTNEKQDSRPSTLPALTTFIVFPCSIERNVNPPAPFPTPLCRPSSFDSGFFLFLFFLPFSSLVLRAIQKEL